MYVIKRNKIFHLFYYDINGVLKSKSTRCPTKREANKIAQTMLEEIQRSEKESKLITYKQYKQIYIDYTKNRFTKNYQEFVGSAFSQFGKRLDGEILLKDIRIEHVESFIKFKLTSTKELLVNGYLRCLQAAFQRAVEFEYLADNIFKRVKKLKAPENYPVFMSKVEFHKIVDTEDDWQLKIIYKVAFYTGMRLSEIRYLKKYCVDFTSKIITVKNHNEFTTKSKRSRVIPINQEILNDLQSACTQSISDYIFTRQEKIIRKDFICSRFKRVVQKADVDKRYHFHSLRHSFASILVQKGISIYLVSKLLGHADIKTTMIYSHLRTEDLRNAVETLDLT